jgi:hypothetical protein
MKKTFATWTIIFACVQLTGLVCLWMWRYAPPAASSFVWGTALVALFPGNILSAILIEKLFWSSRLSLTTMAVAEIPVLLSINALLWFGLATAVRRLGRRHTPRG